MQVVEIFKSLQGEGRYAGLPTVFIRVAKCSGNCNFCDTEYAKTADFKEMNDLQILRAVRKFGISRVCITGGEPLEQPDFTEVLYTLTGENFEVSVETGGFRDISYFSTTRRFSVNMDFKCPSSGMSARNRMDNLRYLTRFDDLNFVIKDKKDLEYARGIVDKVNPLVNITLTPVDNNKKVVKLITEYLMEGKIKGRLVMQMHKIWGIK